MESNSTNGRPENVARGARAAAGPANARRRAPWPLIVVAALFVVLPFLSWYGTSFWRTLGDEEIEKYLREEGRPRRVQHALEQIDRRIVAGDAGVRRWYPRVVELARSPVPDLRLAAAWVMGDDNRSPEFHAALLAALKDEEPAVRRMAALSLARFNDASGRDELLSMLRPYGVKAPVAGVLLTVLPEGKTISREAMIARVRDASGKAQEVRSPLSGKIEKVTARAGARVAAGDELLVLAPDSDNVWEALRALYLVGRAEELAEVERYARGVEGVPAVIAKQAALTAGAIRARAGRNSN